MENLSGFDISIDWNSMSCHFLPPGKRKQKKLFAFASAFLNPLLENGFHYENRRVRQYNPAEKHRQNDEQSEDKTKPAFPDSGEARFYCCLQPLF